MPEWPSLRGRAAHETAGPGVGWRTRGPFSSTAASSIAAADGLFPRLDRAASGGHRRPPEGMKDGGSQVAPPEADELDLAVAAVNPRHAA